MSGYEQEPEYGGPDPEWKETVLLVAVFVGVTVVFLLLAL